MYVKKPKKERPIRYCKSCGTALARRPGEQIGNFATRTYCEKSCRIALAERRAAAKAELSAGARLNKRMPNPPVQHTCETCGGNFMFQPKQGAVRKGWGRFCSHKCVRYVKRWTPSPYIRVPRSMHRSMCEHIMIAEKALGHPLPAGAVVHHHDRNPQNNANSNLVICENNAYHRHLHWRGVKLGIYPPRKDAKRAS